MATAKTPGMSKDEQGVKNHFKGINLLSSVEPLKQLCNWIHLFRPIYLDPSTWTRLFGPVYLDPCIWTHLFRLVNGQFQVKFLRMKESNFFWIFCVKKKYIQQILSTIDLFGAILGGFGTIFSIFKDFLNSNIFLKCNVQKFTALLFDI